MLRVKAYLADSSVHGIGLFAAEDITEGTVIWEFHPGADHVYTVGEFTSFMGSLDPAGVSFLSSYIYKRNGLFYLLVDNTRFINHSESCPNLTLLDDHTEVATRDIEKGEEFLEDYFSLYDHDDPFFREIRGEAWPLCESLAWAGGRADA